jgi:RNA polymerase sigma-70 factor, ECF subfamily
MGIAAAMDELTAHRMIELLPRLRRFAHGLSGDADDAEDLVQIGCERAVANIDRWTPGTRLDSWMFAIIRNAYLDMYRGRAVRSRQAAEVRHSGDGELDGVRAAEAKLTLSRVLSALDDTPEEQRSALLLALVEGLSYEEIAQVQEVPLGTVTSRIGRARQSLRSLLDDGEKAKGGVRHASTR